MGLRCFVADQDYFYAEQVVSSRVGALSRGNKRLLGMVLNGIAVPYAHQYCTGGDIICRSMKSWKTARFLQFRLWYWIVGSYSC